MKSNISIGDKMKFVDNVFDICKVDGVVNYSLYDFAFRSCIVLYFRDSDNIDADDAEKMNEYVYSEKYNEILEAIDVNVYDALVDACAMKLEDERYLWQLKTKSSIYPDPIDIIADSVSKGVDALIPAFSQENVVSVVQQMRKERGIDGEKNTEINESARKRNAAPSK